MDQGLFLRRNKGLFLRKGRRAETSPRLCQEMEVTIVIDCDTLALFACRYIARTSQARRNIQCLHCIIHHTPGALCNHVPDASSASRMQTVRMQMPPSRQDLDAPGSRTVHNRTILYTIYTYLQFYTESRCSSNLASSVKLEWHLQT